MTNKEKILDYIKNNKKLAVNSGRNRMGCSEEWYDPFYAISEALTLEEIEDMSEREISLCLKCIEAVEDGLY